VSQSLKQSGSFRESLGLADFSFLVVGAIIGDGVYVLASMGAASLGPAQIVAWFLAGVLACFIAIAFVQCAIIDTDVGGSYAYARRAFGPFIGFLAGWTLYIGEWLALSAFPKAFFNYFQSLTGAPDESAIPVKVLLIAGVTTVNFVGVRQGARTNDALTAAKLLPLALLAVLGLLFILVHPQQAQSHLQPFAPLGWGGLGSAVLPIFWAYAGFELAVLPAAEVRDAHRTVPRGLIIGVSVATSFYLLLSLTYVVALPWQDLAASTFPLATVMQALLEGFGGPAGAGFRLMSLGALISITGVFLVFTLGLARLSYALAADGFLPAPFARLHPRFDTPYVGLVFQAVCALVFGILLDLRSILSTAVLFLSICYLLTALSALRFVSLEPRSALHLPALRLLLVLAAAASLFLTAQASLVQAAVTAGALLCGCVLFFLHLHSLHHPKVTRPDPPA
jgi:amino acid transporter